MPTAQATTSRPINTAVELTRSLQTLDITIPWETAWPFIVWRAGTITIWFIFTITCGMIIRSVRAQLLSIGLGLGVLWALATWLDYRKDTVIHIDNSTFSISAGCLFVKRRPTQNLLNASVYSGIRRSRRSRFAYHCVKLHEADRGYEIGENRLSEQEMAWLVDEINRHLDSLRQQNTLESPASHNRETQTSMPVGQPVNHFSGVVIGIPVVPPLTLGTPVVPPSISREQP